MSFYDLPDWLCLTIIGMIVSVLLTFDVWLIAWLMYHYVWGGIALVIFHLFGIAALVSDM